MKILGLFGVIILFNSCSEFFNPDNTLESYGGPGSVWNSILNYSNNTFEISRRPSIGSNADLTVIGTFSTLPSGFLKFSILTSSGTGAPAPGSSAYALDIQGFAFILKPFDGMGEMIPMVKAGQCPSSSFNANWIVVRHRNGNASSNSSDYYGTLSSTLTNGSIAANLSSRYSLTHTSIGSSVLTAGASCSGGVLTMGADATIWLTKLGGAIVATNQSNTNAMQSILAMPNQTITAANLDGNYFGWIFSGNSNGVTPVSLVMSASGVTGTVKDFTNIDTGAVSATTLTIDFTGGANNPSAGFLKGVLTKVSNSNTGNIQCMVTENIDGSTKHALFCVGQDPDDNTKQFSALFRLN